MCRTLTRVAFIPSPISNLHWNNQGLTLHSNRSLVQDRIQVQLLGTRFKGLVHPCRRKKGGKALQKVLRKLLSCLCAAEEHEYISDLVTRNFPFIASLHASLLLISNKYILHHCSMSNLWCSASAKADHGFSIALACEHICTHADHWFIISNFSTHLP